MRTNKINEPFKCMNCGQKNPEAPFTCRNHCLKCLFSLHVDRDLPGDRNSSCKSLMAPVGIEKDGKKGLVIVHQCLKCGKIMRNKTAEDDNMELIINLSAQPCQEIVTKKRRKKFSNV